MPPLQYCTSPMLSTSFAPPSSGSRAPLPDGTSSKAPVPVGTADLSSHSAAHLNGEFIPAEDCGGSSSISLDKKPAASSQLQQQQQQQQEQQEQQQCHQAFKKTTTKVSFAPYAKQRNVLSRKFYTEEERAACWYTQKEQLERDEAFSLMVEQLEMEEELPGGLTGPSVLRGLETSTKWGKQVVNLVVTNCVRDVLSVQERRLRQQLGAIACDDGSGDMERLEPMLSDAYWESKIARASRKVSQQCADFALEMAQYDHDEAMMAYRNPDEKHARQAMQEPEQSKEEPFLVLEVSRRSSLGSVDEFDSLELSNRLSSTTMLEEPAIDDVGKISEQKSKRKSSISITSSISSEELTICDDGEISVQKSKRKSSTIMNPSMSEELTISDVGKISKQKSGCKSSVSVQQQQQHLPPQTSTPTLPEEGHPAIGDVGKIKIKMPFRRTSKRISVDTMVDKKKETRAQTEKRRKSDSRMAEMKKGRKEKTKEGTKGRKKNKSKVLNSLISFRKVFARDPSKH